MTGRGSASRRNGRKRRYDNLIKLRLCYRSCGRKSEDGLRTCRRCRKEIRKYERKDNKQVISAFTRLFSKPYIVKEAERQNHKSGKIIIDSQFLKDYVGQKIRVIVYVPRKQ